MSVQHKNECVFTGRITGSKTMPDGFSFRYIQNGMAILKLIIVCNSQYKAADGSMKTSTVYVDCTAFGKLAEDVKEKLSLGVAVEVVTEYRKRQYNDRGGVSKTSHEFIAKTIEVVTDAAPAGASKPAQSQRPQQQVPQGGGYGSKQYSRPPQQPQAQRQAPPPPPRQEEEWQNSVDNEDIPF
jgi:single stranded DNA-binding protein